MNAGIGIGGAPSSTPRSLRCSRFHAAQSAPNVEVVAVAARHVGRAREFAARHGISHALGDYEELLATPEVDAIYNPQPNGLHGLWSLAAVRAGKHVLCEKPFAANG